ncbi:ABC transporter permease [Paenibacillus hunanensis]|uniref:ABC transporter permease n=1 Tax=Paenibacillus hunanensis TaxID=539262 RepID=UPI002026825A|nr:ABC transporter permease [Paenibacillus hunanensis]MCL9660101.1 ABC transporter permease [Paenibacillus hunanensis]
MKALFGIATVNRRDVANQAVQAESRGWKRQKRQQRFSLLLAGIASALVALLIVFALVPQWIAPYSPTAMMADRILQPPGTANWLGTDYFGRDILSLVIYGTRVSLLIGFSSVLAGVLAGGILGALAGYAGGWTDTIIMRMMDILMTIPGVLLALAIAAALGPGLPNIVLAIAAASIPGYARVMRGGIVGLRTRSYIESARALGASNWHVIRRHILPNAVSPVLVMATIGLGSSILTGAGLSFLGLGTVSEIPDWGALLSQGRGYLTVAWWICTFPGLAITSFVLAVNLIGDELRDRLDPRVGA